SLASNAIVDPSGETPIPPMSVRGCTVSFVPAVRLIGSPPARNFTHTSVAPRALDRNAIHLPSGESAGADSSAGPLVSRTTREKVGAAAAVPARLAMRLATIAEAAAVTTM